jgi:hypothetical protein
MKKLKLKKLRSRQPEQAPSRITNETVAEHREQILAGGRRFKYPIQYARHKLVFNAIAIVVIAAVLLVLLGWWQLYIVQNSSSFLYRLTRIFPVPVASIDGEQVRFSDYLVQYRGSEFYLSKYDQLKITSKDGQEQLKYIKRESLNRAIVDAYAAKVARQKNIQVTEKDITDIIDQQRNTVNGRISQQTYDASSLMMYDWTPSDYRLAVKRSILRARVAFAVDDKAKQQADKAAGLVASTSGDFAKVAESFKNDGGEKVVAGDSSLINMVSTFGGLRVSDLKDLAKDQISGPITTTSDSGYYFVKIIDKTDTKIRFSYLFIPLSELDNRIAELKKSGKIREYISVSEAKGQNSSDSKPSATTP